MNSNIAELAGKSLAWRALQMVGIKSIALIRILILTRLVLPEDFGLVAIALTTVAFFQALTELGMMSALIQQVNEDEKMYDVAWTARLIRAVAVSIIIIVFAPLMAVVFDEPRARWVIVSLAVLPLLDAIGSIKVARLTKNLQFRSLALMGMGGAVVNMIVALTLAGSLGVWALVLGMVAGAASNVILSYLFAPHRPRFKLQGEKLRGLIRYGRWIFATSLVAVTGDLLFKATISRLLGSDQLGTYYLAASIAFLPATIAVDGFGSVAFPLYARLQTNRLQIIQAFQAFLSAAMVTLTPVSVLIAVLAPSLVESILDPRWSNAASIIQILTLAGLLGMFGEISVPLFKGTGKPSYVTAAEVVQSIGIVAFAWWLVTVFGLNGAALGVLLAVIFSQIVSAVLVKKTIAFPLRVLGRRGLTVVFVSTIGGAVAFGLDRAVGAITGLVVAAAASSVIVIILVWRLDSRFDLGFVRDLSRAFPQIAIFNERQV